MFKNGFILAKDHLNYKGNHVKSSLRMTELAYELMMELFQFTLLNNRLQDVKCKNS